MIDQITKNCSFLGLEFDFQNDHTKTGEPSKVAQEGNNTTATSDQIHDRKFHLKLKLTLVSHWSNKFSLAIWMLLKYSKRDQKFDSQFTHFKTN